MMGGCGARGGLSKKAVKSMKARAEKKSKNTKNDDDHEYGQSKNKRITGLWRHKDWRRCSIGMTAIPFLPSSTLFLTPHYTFTIPTTVRSSPIGGISECGCSGRIQGWSVLHTHVCLLIVA